MTIIARAYQVDDRVMGPDWLVIQGYDIVAKLPPDTKEENSPLVLRRSSGGSWRVGKKQGGSLI